MRDRFFTTRIASYTGYAVQAITINFAPMLFIRFMTEFELSVTQISLIVALTFAVQLTADLVSVKLIGPFGYRRLCCAAHALCATGLLLMAVLPNVMPPFWGLVSAIVLYSSGSGFIEVVISPIIESCPSKNKAAQMSLLHSFYCWGQLMTVGISTLFFVLFGIENWRFLAALWALVPAANFFVFLFCPLNTRAQTEKSRSASSLIKSKMFLCVALIILCAGASEIAVSQWASAYCETALGVSKTLGDIAGPMAFALFMGVSRMGYALLGARVRLERFMLLCGALCVSGYLVIAFSPFAWMGLCGFALCGFSVGILWPGTFSLASKHIDGGGSMFALLSFAGDSGCMIGPYIAGLFAAMKADDIGFGISCAGVFPVVMCAALALFAHRVAKKHTGDAQNTTYT